MRRLLNIAGSIVGLGLVAILAVMLISALRATQPSETQIKPAQSPLSTPMANIEPTPVPIEATKPVKGIFESPVMPTPTLERPDTPTPVVIESPPLCEFDDFAGETKQSESSIDRYVFLEPKAIFSHKGPIEISQWLPDSKRVLISRENTDTGLSFIETVDVKTQETGKYGEGRLGSLAPSHKFVWLTANDSVAFTTLEPDSHYALHISQGDGEVKTEPLDLASGYLTVHPNGQQLLFAPYNSAQAQFLDVTTKQIQTLDIKGATVNSETEGYIDFWSRYQSVWNPDGKHLAYFNNQAFLLFNVESGKTCEVDLGTTPDYGKQWAMSAQWSFDGRYLAVQKTVGEPPVPYIELTIVDIMTGELRTLNIGNRENVYAVAWGANNRDIFAVAQVVTRQSPTEVNGHNLYIVDTVTGKFRQILQDSEFFFSGNAGVAWEFDEKRIALMCPTFLPSEPTMDEGRLCIIDVEVK